MGICTSGKEKKMEVNLNGDDAVVADLTNKEGIEALRRQN